MKTLNTKDIVTLIEKLLIYSDYNKGINTDLDFGFLTLTPDQAEYVKEELCDYIIRESNSTLDDGTVVEYLILQDYPRRVVITLFIEDKNIRKEAKND